MVSSRLMGSRWIASDVRRWPSLNLCATRKALGQVWTSFSKGGVRQITKDDAVLLRRVANEEVNC